MQHKTVHIHLIPGLGVDHRLFQWLEFSDHVQPHYWNWEAPLPEESLQTYAQRYVNRLIPDVPNVLLGVSFGGIVAQEVAKLIAVDKLILISSIKHHDELPWYFGGGRFVPVHSWISGQLIKTIGATIQRALGDRGEGARLFESMLEATPDAFMPWAIDQLIHWKQVQTPSNLVH